jgi:nucleoprotein TPR
VVCITSLTPKQADKGNRIVELQEQLTAAQAQASQAGSTGVADADIADQTLTEEVATLKQQLSEAQKALEDARTELDSSIPTGPDANAEVKIDTAQGDAENTVLKAELDEREAKLKEAETALTRREEKVTTREGKTAEIQRKAQDKIHSIRNESNEKIAGITRDTNEEIARLKSEIAELQAEITRLKESREKPNESNATTVVYKDLLDEETSTVLNKPIDTEGLLRPTVNALQLKAWINGNPGAKVVIAEQIRKHIAPYVEQVKAKDAELAKLNQNLKGNSQNRNETAIKPEENQAQDSSQSVEAALAQAKAEHERAMKDALEAREKQHKMHLRAKVSLLQNGQNKWIEVEKISKETPTMEVSKAVVMAVEEAKKPKPQATTPAPQPAQVQPSMSSTPAQSLPTTATIQQPNRPQSAMGSNAPVANGTNVPGTAQPLQTTSAQAGYGSTPNAFIAAQAGRGIAPPGFTGQTQLPTQQQQQQQGGRGRGESMGTSHRALQGMVGNQSNVPRGGGSNIPLPGGRGRGQPQQQQLNANQPLNINTQNPGTSQIGRGGNRGGRGGGRGGAQPNQSSPRGSLNPGAAQFQPQPGMGRGQKRNAEDEGDGSARGGKRPRGRGGQGGGGASAGGA